MHSAAGVSTVLVKNLEIYREDRPARIQLAALYSTTVRSALYL